MTATNPILTLARSGATSRAWDAFLAAGLDGANDISALTLKGRLLKDRARQAVGAERGALFAQSGAAYAQAATLRPDSYPLINAAAMALLAGDQIKAQLYANKVLDLIESGADTGETPYWGEATRAEALLLLDRRDDAEEALGEAIIRAPQAWEDHAATLRQFAALLKAKSKDAAWLDPYRPPASLHFSGILGIAPDDEGAHAAIKSAITDISPGFAYGALAAGADIIAAEVIVATGAELHVVLPSPPDDFCRSSVESFGAEWRARYEALLDAATSLTICGEGNETSGAGIALADYHAMGMAAEHASLLESCAVAIRIEPDQRPTLGDPWLASGRPLIHVPVSASDTTPASSALDEGSLIFLLALADDSEMAEPLGFGSLAEAIAALPDRPATAALDCRTDSDSGTATALLQNATPGTIVASSAAAMALMAEGRADRIEPLGEMETADGATGVYSVRLSGAP